MKDDIEIRVKRVLMDEFGVDESEVTPDASLIDDLGLENLGLTVVELSIRLEQEFAIAIPDQDMDQVRTVRDLYDCVIHHTG